MGNRYLLELADVARAAGLSVVEVDGWEVRARSSGGFDGDRPWCVMWHHTASDTTPDNDVNYIVAGSPDAPLANLYLAHDGIVYVCAAGATNTNGKGGPLTVSRGVIPADSMNTYGVGIEAANNGVGQTWPQVQIDAYFVLSGALTFALGLDPDDLCTHAEWAPGRKIDPATAGAVVGPWRPAAINANGTWSVDDVRLEAIDRSGPVPPGPDPGGDELMFTMFDMMGNTYGGYMDSNGIFAQVTWLSPSRFAACSAAGADHVGELSPADLANCDLLGPVPPGTPPATFANVIG